MNRLSTQGFTLIEVVIYLALVTLLMFGAVSLAYGVGGASHTDRMRSHTVEAGNFALQKIAWATSVSSDVVVQNQTITFHTMEVSTNPIVIRYDSTGKTLGIQEGTNAYVVIAEEVTGVSFTKINKTLSVQFSIKGQEFHFTRTLAYE